MPYPKIDLCHNQYQGNVSLCFLLCIFRVSDFSCKSLTHFELIFVKNYCSNIGLATQLNGFSFIPIKAKKRGRLNGTRIVWRNKRGDT